MKNESFIKALNEFLSLMDNDNTTIYFNEKCTNNLRETTTEITKTTHRLMQRNYNKKQIIELLFDVIYCKEHFLVTEHHYLIRKYFIQNYQEIKNHKLIFKIDSKLKYPAGKNTRTNSPNTIPELIPLLLF